jgi:hypothetical protein
MHTCVQIEIDLLEVLYEEGRLLPSPMMTITSDSNTRVILDVQISGGNLGRGR